jgi:hypothetical protein
LQAVGEENDKAQMVFFAIVAPVVSKLYYQAKTERIPMTVLANRIIERALGPNEPSDIPLAKENNAEAGAE